MPISVTCSECEAAFRVPDEVAGKAVKCKKCGARISVPANGGNGSGTKPAARSAEAAAGEKKKGNTGKILLIVGGILAVFCLVCGGGAGIAGWYIYSGAKTAVKNFDDDVKKAFKDLDKSKDMSNPFKDVKDAKDAFKDLGKDNPFKDAKDAFMFKDGSKVDAPKGAVIYEKKETLSQKDPSKNGKPTREYRVKLDQGKKYVIDLRADNPGVIGNDPYLRLLDPTGKEVAADDDGGGFPHARIRHDAALGGDYTIQATTFSSVPPGGIAFTLTVRQE